MKLVIYLLDGSVLSIENLAVSEAADLRTTMMEGEVPAFIQLLMDETTVLVSTTHITRIEMT